MKDKNYLHQMFNGTCTDDGNGDIETYENWLERQLLARIERLEQLRLYGVSQQRELLKAFQEYYQTGDYNDEYPFDENINRFLKAFNCG